eukprot:g20493.t1
MKVFAFSICVLATVASAASRSSSSVAEMTKTKEKVRAQRPTMEQRPDLARNEQGVREIMTKESAGAISQSADKMALTQAHEYCVAETDTDGQQFTECTHDLYHNSAINNGEGGGGGGWRNSIYMFEGPDSCPSGYDKTDPTKPELYGDVPKVGVPSTRDADNVADDWTDGHSDSEYASVSLGYSPYSKVDNTDTALTSQEVADWCGTECTNDDTCEAMASDGLSACFLYDKDNLPTPYRTPGNFITCRKKNFKPEIGKRVLKLAEFVADATAYVVDNAVGGSTNMIANVDALEVAVADTTAAAIEAIYANL